MGLNVSGLLFNEPKWFGQYGLRADYRATVEQVVRDLVAVGTHVHSRCATC